MHSSLTPRACTSSNLPLVHRSITKYRLSPQFAERSIVTKMRLRAGRSNLHKNRMSASSDLDGDGELVQRKITSELLTEGWYLAIAGLAFALGLF